MLSCAFTIAVNAPVWEFVCNTGRKRILDRHQMQMWIDTTGKQRDIRKRNSEMIAAIDATVQRFIKG